jgi:hypothetical protein
MSQAVQGVEYSYSRGSIPGSKEVAVKRTVVFLILLALLSLLVLSSGCGGSKSSGSGDDDNTGGDFDRVEFDKGYADGSARGYDQGYGDGKQDVYDPGVQEEADASDYYALGFNEGWVEGYEDGYKDALAEIADAEEEMAEVEAAMLAFVKQNAAPGLEFKIENIVIHGDEAAGLAVCTSETLESPLVVMKKGASGWNAVDFGTGIEPPPWYKY